MQQSFEPSRSCPKLMHGFSPRVIAADLQSGEKLAVQTIEDLLWEYHK